MSCFTSVALLACLVAPLASALSLSAEPDKAAPSPVGTRIVWTAGSTNNGEEPIWYRFSVRAPGDHRFRVARDYHPSNSWAWTPSQLDGRYEVEITARNPATGDSASLVRTYQISSRVSSDEPVITPTANQLVFLYSAPPCADGSRMVVEFTAADGFHQETNPIQCRTASSTNVYLAGLRAASEYRVQHRIVDGEGEESRGPVMSLQTEPLTFGTTETLAVVRPQDHGVLLQTRIFEPSVATDLQGNVIWYYSELTPYLVRPEAGGYFFVLVENHESPTTEQFLRKIDLAGNIVLETNAARTNEQLAAMGRQQITSFHHDAFQLPNGHIMAIAGTERLIQDVQGPGEQLVLGDAIVVFNQDLDVVWFWDAFHHMDLRRAAVLGDVCERGGGGCPAFYLGDQANDWLHGNSIFLTPEGNILYSARSQDWVIKIHYAAGFGSGEVLWRLGEGGDFRVESDDPAPWFSAQHYANVSQAGPLNHVLLFDNGNSRAENSSNVRSRGQVYELDTMTRTARLILNFDLGSYAFALGSSERLANGNYHFAVGWTPEGHSDFLEYDSIGRLVSHLKTETQVYRALRMPNLYTPVRPDWMNALVEGVTLSERANQ